MRKYWARPWQNTTITRCDKNVHAGTNHVGDSVNTPIFLSSTYKLTEERYAGWAAGAQHTLLYSRLSSVNSDAVAQKICAMEGGEDAETFASGMAAISTTMLMLLNQGDHIVASADVYGGTYGLMTEELPRLGIETTMADIRDPSSYEAAIQDNTKIMYIETITNPNLKVCDIPAMVEVAKRHNLLVVVDNTFASPWGCQPLSMGADLVIHSTTKYLGGHSDLLGEQSLDQRSDFKDFHGPCSLWRCSGPTQLLPLGTRYAHPSCTHANPHGKFCRTCTPTPRSPKCGPRPACYLAFTFRI